MIKRRFYMFFIGLLLLVFYCISLFSLNRFNSQMGDVTDVSLGVWNLPEIALLAMAGEFKGLWSDYLALEGGAQMGSKLLRKPDGGYKVAKVEYDWKSIYKVFQASQRLDPAFSQPYIVVQGWFPWAPANMIQETQKFLRITVENRPWDWKPLHTLGFNEYYHLSNPGKAGELFIKAATVPNAPSFLPILGARLAQKGGETQTAIVLMKSMLQAKDSTEPGYDDVVYRLNALEGVLLIEKATKQFKDQTGGLPRNIDALINGGFLDSEPDNPYGIAYCIDDKGSVFFDNPNCVSK